MTFKNERFHNFREVIRYNFEALNKLSSIRLGLEEKRADIENTFLETVNYVGGMVEQYSRVADLKESEQSILNAKLLELKAKGRKPVVNLNYAKKFGYQGTSLMKENSEALFNAVENISKPMQDPTKPGFVVENVNTLHDFIRYLHQKTIDTMFDVKDANGSVENKHLLHTEIKVVDLDNNSQNNKCLSEIVEEYTRIAQFKPGHETLKVISIGDYVNAHLQLGCHTADLSVMVDGSGSFLDLKYQEGHFAGQERKTLRQRYIAECLSQSGFKTVIKLGLLDAKLRDKSEETVKRAIRTVVRLLASSKDLDICKNLQDQSDVSFAVEYFTSGGINTRKAMGIRRELKTTLDENKEASEALRYLEHRVKTNLHRMSAEEQEFLKEFLVKEFAQKYSGSEAQLKVILEAKELLTERPADLMEFSKVDFSKISMLDDYYFMKDAYLKNIHLFENPYLSSLAEKIALQKEPLYFSLKNKSIKIKEYHSGFDEKNDSLLQYLSDSNNPIKPIINIDDNPEYFINFSEKPDYKIIITKEPENKYMFSNENIGGMNPEINTEIPPAQKPTEKGLLKFLEQKIQEIMSNSKKKKKGKDKKEKK